jgi:putative flippase GtrA
VEKLLHMARQAVFIRYVLISAGALAVDLGLFLVGLNLGVNSVVASATGYISGILAHWMLSSRTIFQDRVADRGTIDRTKQKFMFTMSATLGLGVTIIIVALGEMISAEPRVTKLFAVAASFLLTFALRNSLIFRKA